ncbi:MAG: Gldg family protein, partial [Casimicrobiaceae bacterium]
MTFHGYLSPDDHLPPVLVKLHTTLEGLLDGFAKRAGGKLHVEFQDPDANGGKLAQDLKRRYGFGAQIANLADPKPFWFYMVLTRGDDTVQVPLPDTLDKTALERSLDAAIRRLAPGYFKTVALVTPPAYGAAAGPRYTRLSDALSQNARVVPADLSKGYVPADADLLLVMAPQKLGDKARFAIDQFLMRGGSVVLATSPFDVEIGQSLTAHRVDSGLKEWLKHYGITIGDSMVLDTHDAALPIPVESDLGGIPVREIRMLPYPQFPDLRGAGLDPRSPITANLGQLTMNWASPITLDQAKKTNRKLADLLSSSPASWTSSSLDVVPDYATHPDTGFAVSGPRGPHLLALALEGSFESYYA